MSVIAWLILGLIAGFIANKLSDGSGEGILIDIVIGIIGAVVGGCLFSEFGAVGVTKLNLYSVPIAAIGSIVALAIYHALVGRRTI